MSAGKIRPSHSSFFLAPFAFHAVKLHRDRAPLTPTDSDFNEAITHDVRGNSPPFFSKSRDNTSALLLAFCANARAVTIDWTTVGNPNNPADTQVMVTDSTSGYGSVPYTYQIDKYDVTDSQYTEFLNAKDPTGTNACTSITAP